MINYRGRDCKIYKAKTGDYIIYKKNHILLSTLTNGTKLYKTPDRILDIFTGKYVKVDGPRGLELKKYITKNI
jgi:hypothetical protein